MGQESPSQQMNRRADQAESGGVFQRRTLEAVRTVDQEGSDPRSGYGNDFEQSDHVVGRSGRVDAGPVQAPASGYQIAHTGPYCSHDDHSCCGFHEILPVEVHVRDSISKGSITEGVGIEDGFGGARRHR